MGKEQVSWPPHQGHRSQTHRLWFTSPSHPSASAALLIGKRALLMLWTQIHWMWSPATLSAAPWESTHAKEKPPGRGYPWHKRWCGGGWSLGTCLKRTQKYILIWLSDFITKHLLKTNKLYTAQILYILTLENKAWQANDNTGNLTLL